MIVFVIVAFNREVSRLPTLLTLQDSLRKVAIIEHHILLLDNSETPNPAADLKSLNCTYVPFGRNVGIAKAYNHALEYCIEHRAEVLVTLDQDSTVTPAYLEALRHRVVNLNDSVVALCPRVQLCGRALSPWTFNVLGFPEFWPNKGRLFAINSFSAYSVSYLQSVGFDEFYWLDGLDFSTYAKIHLSGKQAKLLDVTVEHDLSLVSGAVNPTRFYNITYYEASFLTEYCSMLHIASGLLRLILRSHRVTGSGSLGRYLVSSIRAATSGALAGMRRRNRHARTYFK